MTKYIEKRAAIDACFNGWNNSADDCARNIKLLPAADVIRPVRCWECKYVTRWRDEESARKFGQI